MKKTSIGLFLITSSLLLSAQGKKVNSVKVYVPSSLQQTLQRGKVVYQKTCITCHQVDGGGVMGLNPPLINTKQVLGDKTRLIKIVKKGLNEPIEIEGDVYSNPMPPQTALTDQEIADVLSYVRNSFGNNASTVSPAEVKKMRSTK